MGTNTITFWSLISKCFLTSQQVLALLVTLSLKGGESQPASFFASFQKGNKHGNLKIDQGMFTGQLPSNPAALLLCGYEWPAAWQVCLQATPTHIAVRDEGRGTTQMPGPQRLPMPFIEISRRSMAVLSSFLPDNSYWAVSSSMGRAKRLGWEGFSGHQRKVRSEITSKACAV